MNLFIGNFKMVSRVLRIAHERRLVARPSGPALISRTGMQDLIEILRLQLLRCAHYRFIYDRDISRVYGILHNILSSWRKSFQTRTVRKTVKPMSGRSKWRNVHDGKLYTLK